MAAKLSLKAKQDIRDNWEKKQPELLERLKKSTGVDWKFDINFEEFHNNIGEEDRKVQVGSVILWNMEALVYNIERKTQDEVVKQALVDNVKTRVIKLLIGNVVGTYNDSYHDTIVAADGITVVVKKDSVASNVDSIGQNLETLLTSGGLPLVSKINVRDYWDNTKSELLDKLKSASGVAWTFEVDFKKLFDSIKEDGRKDQIGQVAFWNLEGLVDNLVRKMKDDMVKEAILDAAPKHVISLYIGNVPKGYHDVKFQDGGIHVVVKADSVASNVSEIGDHIDDLL